MKSLDPPEMEEKSFKKQRSLKTGTIKGKPIKNTQSFADSSKANLKDTSMEGIKI